MKNVWLNRRNDSDQQVDLELRFEHLQKTYEENYHKWLSFFLENDKWTSKFHKHGAKIAMILENQQLFDKLKNEDHLEMSCEIYEHFIGFDLVSIQPMLGPGFRIYYKEFHYDPISKKTNLNLSIRDACSKNTILKCLTGQEIADEMSREIIGDLRKHAGTIITKEWDGNKEIIRSNMKNMQDVLYRKTLRRGQQWIVTGPEIADILTGKRVNKIQSIGPLLHSSCNIIVDPLYPTREILVGFQDDLLDGYFYNPYIPLKDCKNSIGMVQFSTSCSKRLISNKAYGKIIYK